MKVGDRDLGRRDQEQLVARDDVHLVFLVRDLAGPGGARRVDDGGRPHLGHPVLAGVHVEEPVDQPALERRSGAQVDGEPGPGDLGAAGVVEDAERLAQLPVRLAGPGRAAHGRIGADLADQRLLPWQHLAPHPDRDVGLLAADRDVRVGRVRDAQQEVFEGRFGGGDRRLEPFDLRADVRGLPPEERHIGVGPGVGTGLDQLADPRAHGVPSGLVALDLTERAAPFGIELQGAIDERRILALPDGAVADDVRLVAQPLQPDTHEAPPTVAARVSAASRRRPIVNIGSRLAKSQPARGPFVRPRNAR